MAVRYPLVIDTTDNNKIKELPLNDSLNLSSNSIVNAVNITASGTLTVANLVVDTNSVSINGNSIATVALTNSYTDLSNKPSLFDGQYASLTGRPTIVSTTEDLADVSSTQATNGQALIYNSTSGVYEPGSIADAALDLTSQSISELADVAVISISTNQVLKWTGATFANSNIAFNELTGTPTTLSGYGITNAYTKAEVDAQISAPTGDLKGSVFGDDSALLVDGINSKIVGPIDTNGGQARFSSLVSQYSDLASISPVTYHGMIIHVHSEGAWYGAHAGAWYKIADVVNSLAGDLKGSVFADDSTILVDAVNGKIVGNVESQTVFTRRVNLEKINAADPEPVLQLTSETNTGSFGTSIIQVFNNHTGTYGQELTFNRSNGTYATPTAVQNGDFSGSITIRAHDGSDYTTIGAMHVVTDRIGGADDIDSEINFLTRNGAYASTYGTMLKLGKGATVSGFVQFGSYTTTQRNALTPANGMVIYNTTVNKFQAYENSAWIDITSLDGSHTGTFDGDVTGSVFGDDSTVLVDGVNNTLHGVVQGGLQELVGPGVVNLTTTSTEIVTTGTDAYTLANGTYGQIKHIIKIGGPGAATITPASFANGTSVELASDFNCVSLLYTNSGWAVIAAQNITINA
jgi:inosine/xanthosine triphosphate pyrophosphatase family protein